MPTHSTPEAIIRRLGLEPLSGEGGFFRATWRNETASAILFLITPHNFSAFHRLEQDEVWHFHAGDAIELLQIDPNSGELCATPMGPNVLGGELPQAVVRAGVWQAARLCGNHHGYALLSCTVSPPWDERRFELGSRARLTTAFPAHAELIQALTR